MRAQQGPRFFLKRMRDADTELTAAVRARVAELGYELVDLRRRGSGRRVALRLRIDRPDARPGSGITIGECADVSRALEAWLDREQLLGPQYVLEVSSPGIERPVRWREHWERFRGQEVNVQLARAPRLRATILDVMADRDAVVLRPADGSDDMTVPLEDIRDATLVVDWSIIGRGGSHRGSH